MKISQLQRGVKLVGDIFGGIGHNISQSRLFNTEQVFFVDCILGSLLYIELSLSLKEECLVNINNTIMDMKHNIANEIHKTNKQAADTKEKIKIYHVHAGWLVEQLVCLKLYCIVFELVPTSTLPPHLSVPWDAGIHVHCRGHLVPAAASQLTFTIMSGGHKIDIFVDGFIDILSHDSEHQYLVHSPDQNGTTLLASTPPTIPP